MTRKRGSNQKVVGRWKKTEAKKFSACSCNISESLVEFLGLQLDFDLTLALI